MIYDTRASSARDCFPLLLYLFFFVVHHLSPRPLFLMTLQNSVCSSNFVLLVSDLLDHRSFEMMLDFYDTNEFIWLDIFKE